MKKYDVLGIGVSTIDILSVVEQYPSEEGVQKAIETSVQGGGPVATALVALSKLGGKAAMIDVIGDDWRGKRIEEEFEVYGVSTEHLQVIPGERSAVATILIHQEEKSRHIVFSPGSAAELDPKTITPELISSANYIHMNGRHIEACLRACELSKDLDVKISFDGGANRYRVELDPLIEATDICIVARQFAETCTGETEIERTAEKLLANSEVVVITDGINGSWIFPRGRDSFHQKAYLIEDSVDTTGCGDSYHGAFLYGLANGMPLQETSSLASAVAGLNTRKVGGRAALPSIAEVNDLILAENL